MSKQTPTAYLGDNQESTFCQHPLEAISEKRHVSGESILCPNLVIKGNEVAECREHPQLVVSCWLQNFYCKTCGKDFTRFVKE